MEKDAQPAHAAGTFIDEHFRTILVAIVIVGASASAVVWFWPRAPRT